MDLAIAIVGLISTILGIVWAVYKLYYSKDAQEKKRRKEEDERIHKGHGSDRAKVVETGEAVDKIRAKESGPDKPVGI